MVPFSWIFSFRFPSWSGFSQSKEDSFILSPGLGDDSGDEDGAYTVGQDLEENSKQSAGILPFWIISMFPVIKV